MRAGEEAGVGGLLVRYWAQAVELRSSLLGRFLRKFYLGVGSRGISVAPAASLEADTPFPAAAPFPLSGGWRRSSAREVAANLYVGVQSWLAEGLAGPARGAEGERALRLRRLRALSGGVLREVGGGMRAVTESAVDEFLLGWDFLCEGGAAEAFSGGRAALSRALREFDVHVSGGRDLAGLPEELRRQGAPAGVDDPVGAWPAELALRGELRAVRPEKVGLPERGAFVDAARLLERRRPDLAAALRDPSVRRREPEKSETVPNRVLLADRATELRMYRRWGSAQMAVGVPERLLVRGPAGEVLSAGLFDVGKGSNPDPQKDEDRGIIDRRQLNWAEKEVRCPPLASAVQLRQLALADDERLLFAVSDLPDYYCTLDGGESHLLSNAVGRSFAAWEFAKAGIPLYPGTRAGERVRACLRSVGMGDHKGVPIAQEVHLEILEAGGVGEERLEYRVPVPYERKFYGVIVDDFVAFSREKWAVEPKDSGAEEMLTLALAAYEKEGLRPKASKLRHAAPRGTAWGADIDGEAGIVMAERGKVLQLFLLGLGLLVRNVVSPWCLESWLGGVGFVLGFKRPLYCLLHDAFAFARQRPEGQGRELPSEVGDELLLLLGCFPLARTSLRRRFSGRLWAHDAEGGGGAAYGWAEVGENFARELWRFGDIRGADPQLGREGRPAAASAGAAADRPDLRAVFEPRRRGAALPRGPVRASAAALAALRAWAARGRGLFLELREGGPRLEDYARERSVAVTGLRGGGGGAGEAQTLDEAVEAESAELLLRVAAAGFVRWLHIRAPSRSWCRRRRREDGPERNGGRDERLLRTLAELSRAVLRSGGDVVWEHPRSSRLWDEAVVRELLESLRVRVDVDVVAGGATAKAAVRLMTSSSALRGLRRRPGLDREGARGRATELTPDEFAELYLRVVEGTKGVVDYERLFDDSEVAGLALELPPAPASWPAGLGPRPGALPTAPWEEELDELLPRLRWRASRAWRFKEGRHINVYELKAWARLVRDLSRRRAQHNQRIVSMWDSRVAQAVVAKGRSRSRQLLAELRRTLPHLLGGGFEYAGFWCRSEVQPMDAASRGQPTPPPVDDAVPTFLGRGALVTKLALTRWSSGMWVPRCLGRRPAQKEFDSTLGFPGEGPRWQARTPDPRPLQTTLVGNAAGRRYERAWLKLVEWGSRRCPHFWSAGSLGDLPPREFCSVLLDYVEFGYREGVAHSVVVEGVLAAVHKFWWHRGTLQPVWRVLREWKVREPGELRKPMPAVLAQALISVSLAWGLESESFLRIALCMWLCFHALLRPIEALGARVGQFAFGADFGVPYSASLGVMTIESPKNFRATTLRQHVLLSDPGLLQVLEATVRDLSRQEPLWPMSPATASKRLGLLLRTVGLPSHLYSWGSFRAGGATYEYLSGTPIAHLKFRGRWAAERSLGHYIQEAMAFLSTAVWPEASKAQICRLAASGPAVIQEVILSLSARAPPPAHPRDSGPSGEEGSYESDSDGDAPRL